ncbi:MAG: hypothetical protein L6290_00900 [Thermodesulfovibrionales bacterium]|nr:hypothetical protein [Thermodesulfovibrionales bacterium]
MEELYTETPEIISFVDTERSILAIEIALLDVEKENINLMISEDGCYFSAPSDNTLYVATLSFLCPADPAGAKAKYKEGYLKIDIPLKGDIKNFTKILVE